MYKYLITDAGGDGMVVGGVLAPMSHIGKS